MAAIYCFGLIIKILFIKKCIMKRKLLLSFVVLFVLTTIADASVRPINARLQSVQARVKTHTNAEVKKTVVAVSQTTKNATPAPIQSRSVKSTSDDDVLLFWDFQSLLTNEVPESWTYEGEEDFYLIDFDGYTCHWYGEPSGWDFRLDINDNTNVVLFSQSWVDDAPANAPVNDWFVTAMFDVPDNTSSYEVAWEAKAYQAAPYNDGYDVFAIEDDAFWDVAEVAETDEDLQDGWLAAATLLFSNSVAGENPTWTRRSVDINNFKGKTIRLIYRNTSIDKNAVFINYISANKKEDYLLQSAVVSPFVFEYTQIPTFIGNAYTVYSQIKIDNVGSMDLTGVTATVAFFGDDAPIGTETITIGALASGVSVTKDIELLTEITEVPKLYYYTLTITSTEGALDYLETPNYVGVQASEDVLARDNGEFSGYVYLSEDNLPNKKMGAIFGIPVATTLKSIDFNLYNTEIGTATVRLFKAGTDGSLTEIFNNSTPVENLIEGERIYNIAPTTGDIALEEGTYIATIDEPVGTHLGIVATSNNAGITGAYTLDGDRWYTSNQFTFYIRLNLGEASVRIAALVKESTKAARQGDDFKLTYPASATSVAVYNVTGQRVGEYKLNASGSYTLPAAGWANGVYILKFNGSNTTVKVIK
jgi:hypothetical protein